MGRLSRWECLHSRNGRRPHTCVSGIAGRVGTAGMLWHSVAAAFASRMASCKEAKATLGGGGDILRQASTASRPAATASRYQCL